MQILSRANLLELAKSESKHCSAIIIYEFGKYPDVREIVNNCKDTLLLEMDDVISGRAGGPLKEHVELALKSNFDIVSCKQGVSRSAAIAYLLECQRKGPEEAIKLLDVKKHFPNELILKFGLEILGDSIKPPIVDFYKKLAAHKGWSWQPHNLVTKYFRD